MSSKRNNPSSPSSSPPVNSKKKISCRSTGTTATTVPTPCCSKIGIKRGPWTPEEDDLLSNYVNKNGEGQWRTLPKRAGLLRCGKSCRLRWMNYLRPSVKRGRIAPDEEDLILRLHRLLGNRWSLIAGRIPGRTDNEIKNYWNTHLSKKLISQGIDPRTHKPYNFNPNPNTNNSIPPSSSLSPSQIPHGKYNNNNPLPITQSYCCNNPSFSDHLKKETASKIIHSAIATKVSQKFSSITTKDQLEQYSQLNNQIESGCCPNVHDHNGKFFMVDNIYGKTSNQEVVEEEDNIIGNIGNDDDTFSSFLDSLINDNSFLYQEQEQQPSSSTQAFLSSAQTFTHGIVTWEDEVIMSSIAAVSLLGDEEGGALNNIIHPAAAS